MEANYLKVIAKALFICAVFVSIPAKAEFQLRDITDAVGQVKKFYQATATHEIALVIFPQEWGLHWMMVSVLRHTDLIVNRMKSSLAGQ